MKNENLFRKKGVVILSAVICTLLWGSAFPCIKIGYRMFGIEAGDAGSQMVFAGVRFLLAGAMTITASLFWERDCYKGRRISGRMVRGILLLGLVQTCLQYIFYYIGMAHVTGVKGAIMNGTSAFLCVITAYLFYRQESMSVKKAVGCCIGFAGVIVVNLGKGELGGSFSFLGEGFMLISAVCVALGALISKEVSRFTKPVTLCGWQLFSGGVCLTSVGALAGGRWNWEMPGKVGMALILYMAFISAAAFALWTILLKYNEMGRVTVFNFLIPVFGTMLSAVFLRENIWNLYILLSLPLVCAGIYMVNRE